MGPAPTPRACASEIVETVPVLMRAVRRHVSRATLGQMRALQSLAWEENLSLSEVAERGGLTLPAASRLVDGLVARGWVARERSSSDRRRVTLRLTARGRSLLKSVWKEVEDGLAPRLASLPAPRRAAVVGALRTLRSQFSWEEARGRGA